MEVTRKMLEDYRKIKAEIPLLEYELKEMRLTDAGFGNTVILNGKNGSKKPETVVGFDQAKYDHRQGSPPEEERPGCGGGDVAGRD